MARQPRARPSQIPPRGPGIGAETQRGSHSPESIDGQPEVVRNLALTRAIIQQRRHADLHDEQFVGERVRAVARQLGQEPADAVVDDQSVVEDDHATITNRLATETGISQRGSVRMFSVDQAEVDTESNGVQVLGRAVDGGQLAQVRARYSRQALEHAKPSCCRDTRPRPQACSSGETTSRRSIETMLEQRGSTMNDCRLAPWYEPTSR